jgi:hypothetical protein
MKFKLKQVAPLQAGKMLAALYGAMSLIFVPFMLVFMALGSFAARAQGGTGAPPLPLMFGMGVGFMVLLPFFYAAMGFLAGIIGAWIYNLLAKWVGGFEFEFEPAGTVPPTPPPLS